MRRKRIMVIGASHCGKTTLVNAINDENGPPRKTQDMIYGKYTIDVPGAYIENPWMYKHLIAAAQDASCILLLVDQSRVANVYSPGFAKVFHCPVIGIIAKSDLMMENEAICIRQLEEIGVVMPYCKVSVPQGIGIEELKKYLLKKHTSREGER